MKSTDLTNDLKTKALLNVGRVLVRIRTLSQVARLHPESLDDTLRKIEVLADSAHNIPQLVAAMDQNEWASQETLKTESAMCEAALSAR